MPFIIWSGAADAIIALFLDSHGSDETRMAALQLLDAIEPSQWWTGVPISIRTVLQTNAGSEYGIELSWVSLLLIFGLPSACALLLATFDLFRAIGSRAGAEAFLLSAHFVAATFTSLSIASKSLLVAQFVFLLLCLRYMASAAMRDQYADAVKTIEYGAHKGTARQIRPSALLPGQTRD